MVLLAHLVGDGSYLTHQPLRYTTGSEENSAAVRGAAELFGCRVTRYEGVGNWHQLLISGNGNRWSPFGVGKWLKDLGIFGQRSHQKHLPAAVFSLPHHQVALLLRHLWATEGTIAVSNPGRRGGHAVSFCTCSQRLADDVAALLLRFGIVARIQTVKSGHYRPVYMVAVSGSDPQRTFLREVGAFGPRREPANRLLAALPEVQANTNVDTLPLEAFAAVRAEMSGRGTGARAMVRMGGSAYGGSRPQMASYAQLLESPELDQCASSDLFWDRVVAATADGEEEVFDLTVPGTANWLADGVVSHNSGSLEQDSDIILLIYRDEVYDRNTTRKGIAEIDLVKHRNGETGQFLLTFQGQYTRFLNYMPDSYAEGVLR